VEVESGGHAEERVLNTSGSTTGFALDVTAPGPGHEMLHAILPSFAAVASMFAALLLWLGWRGRRDAGAIQETHRSLKRTAHYDVVTGLLNRSLFTQRLDGVLKHSDAPVSVLFLDLDRFKPVNDTFGHEAGDSRSARSASVCWDREAGRPLCSPRGRRERRQVHSHS
jgi:hypothetical protein